MSAAQQKPQKAQSVLEQFSALKNGDPGTWPIIPRLFVCALALVGVILVGFFIFFGDQQDALDNEIKKEDGLKESYQEKKALEINLPKYRAQRDEVEKSFSALLKQLPNKTEIESLLVEVNQAGLGRGLQFQLFRPGMEEVKDFYAVLPITVQVNGVYHDFGAFAADVAKLPRIVTINNVDISPMNVPGFTGRLAMSMQVRTFRYLSDEEMKGKGGKK